MYLSFEFISGLEEATIILPKKKPSTDPVKLVPKRQLP